MAFSHAKRIENLPDEGRTLNLGVSFHNTAVTVLPPNESWLHCGNMFKHVISNQGVKTQTRFTVLTKEHLCFTKQFDDSYKANIGKGDEETVRRGFSLTSEDQLERAFKEFDTDQSGTVSRSELAEALKNVKLYTTQDNFDALFDKLDRDGSGCLDFEEFQELATHAEANVKIIDSIPLEEIESVEADMKSGSDQAQVVISTTEGGQNRGRVYVYFVPNDMIAEWKQKLDQSIKERKMLKHREHLQSVYGHSRFEVFRAKTREMHQSDGFSLVVAFFIVVGFVIDIAEAQVLMWIVNPTPYSCNPTP